MSMILLISQHGKMRKTGNLNVILINLNLIDNEFLANAHNLSPFNVNFASLHVQCEVCSQNAAWVQDVTSGFTHF